MMVRYAGACGDFHPIHWNERFAQAAGLPGVIAHGHVHHGAGRTAVAAWAGRADAVVDLGVRFTRPVPVPDTDEGTQVVVSGVVENVEDGLAYIGVTAVCGTERVLGQARAIVRL